MPPPFLPRTSDQRECRCPAALHLACLTQSKDYKQWFAELHIDLDKILEISQQMFRLYDLWKNFDEKKEMSALLAKMPKPKTQQPNQR